MFVNQVCSVVAIVGKNQDTPFLGEVFGATLRERDILLYNQNCTTNGLIAPGVRPRDVQVFNLVPRFESRRLPLRGSEFWTTPSQGGSGR